MPLTKRDLKPPVRAQPRFSARGSRLVAVADLPPAGVVEVDTPHGVLAVGMANGRPFAVSNTCRHQFGKLGRGQVTPEGCLECPWHRARYDVRTGMMVSGPKGAVFGFPPYSRTVQTVANSRAMRLRSYPVEERGGEIHLVS